MMKTLNWLLNWYLENCNGDWEHSSSPTMYLS
ncbi:hypothetical protein JNUCC31_00955 [Paenibacillus sp. JNUCC31]|nr:hypothetical protein JNUCC31_00955 [Paenibacillus sp. JNUCC-31]